MFVSDYGPVLRFQVSNFKLKNSRQLSFGDRVVLRS